MGSQGHERAVASGWPNQVCFKRGTLAAVCGMELWLAKAGGRRLCCHISGERPGRRERSSFQGTLRR